jgi:hypothetical protein
MSGILDDMAVIAFIVMLLAIGALIVVARRIERLIDMIEGRGK